MSLPIFQFFLWPNLLKTCSIGFLKTGDSGKEHTGESLQQAAPVFHQAGSFQGGPFLLFEHKNWETPGFCSCQMVDIPMVGAV